MTPLLLLMLAQAALGGTDNLIHHELEAALPSRPGARLELQLHAAREAIYGTLFLGLAWLEWRGAFALLLAALMATEVAITLKDFLVEDRTRRLPPFERVLHTLLAIGFGAMLALLTPIALAWAREPTALAPVNHGLISWAMTAVGVGVAAWAVRNTFAVLALGRGEGAISTANATGTVLITGATGFIGRRLTAALLAQHRRVILLTRDRMAARGQFGPAPMIVESLDELPDELALDAIVNLAGASVAGGLWTAHRRRVLMQSRVETTRRLVAFAARLHTPPGALVNASAVGFYGDRGSELLTEADGHGRGFMADLCAGWEAAAAEAAGLGVRVVTLRLGLVFDWSGGILPMLALPARFGFGARIGKGDQWAPWVHRDDVVRLALAAIDDPAWRGPINAVAPDLVTQGQFTRRLAAHLHRPAWLAAPAAPVRLALGEFSDLFLASQRVIPSAALDLGFVFSRPTLEAAFARSETPLRLARTLPLEGRVAAKQPGGGISPPHDRGRQTPTPGPSPQVGGEKVNATAYLSA
ncbi:MAG TPA: TIGR01777 family oxidoreductase [Caulobacteraceae bacterium]|nr:TIGR01777 family oxidoreductase [Caulobacteraceae bacterium]